LKATPAASARPGRRPREERGGSGAGAGLVDGEALKEVHFFQKEGKKKDKDKGKKDK
jgi:hypothetical protein